MHSLISLLASSALGLLDLGVLALVTSRLGSGPTGPQAFWLVLAVLLKLALLAAGVAYITHQDWYERRAMIAGLLAPFAGFIFWQALRLQMRAQKRA